MGRLGKLAEFAAGPWGALIGKGLLIAIMSGMIWFAVHSYNEGIRNTERMNNQNAQYAQVIKDNQALNKKMDDLQIQNKQILESTAQKNQAVDNKHTQINNYIQSPEAQRSNRESSDVIKKTIGMLRNEE